MCSDTFRVWWGIYTSLCYKFPSESNSERIFKIGKYLVKLWARVRCLVFLTHSVDALRHWSANRRNAISSLNDRSAKICFHCTFIIATSCRDYWLLRNCKYENQYAKRRRSMPRMRWNDRLFREHLTQLAGGHHYRTSCVSGRSVHHVMRLPPALPASSVHAFHVLRCD